MAKRNPSSFCEPTQLSALQTHTATLTASDSFDCQGFDSVLVLVIAGTFTSTASMTVKVQDSADDSTFADIASATFTAITTDNDIAVYWAEVDCRRNERYLQLVGTYAGSGNAPLALMAIGMHASDTADLTGSPAFSV